jgi:hypothetical protein
LISELGERLVVRKQDKLATSELPDYTIEPPNLFRTKIMVQDGSVQASKNPEIVLNQKDRSGLTKPWKNQTKISLSTTIHFMVRITRPADRFREIRPDLQEVVANFVSRA